MFTVSRHFQSELRLKYDEALKDAQLCPNGERPPGDDEKITAELVMAKLEQNHSYPDVSEIYTAEDGEIVFVWREGKSRLEAWCTSNQVNVIGDEKRGTGIELLSSLLSTFGGTHARLTDTLIADGSFGPCLLAQKEEPWFSEA